MARGWGDSTSGGWLGLTRLGWVALEEWAGELAEHMDPGLDQWLPQDFEMNIQVRGGGVPF